MPTAPRTSGEAAGPQAPLRVLFCNWRDTRNPEGGGSEVYVESIATALAAAGHRVTVLCAAHANAPADEVVDGVRFVRRGGKLSVYPQAFVRQLLRRLGPHDVVVDVQNGIPFLSRLAGRTPVVVLVHHVHREQWPVVYGPVRSRIGWWCESRLAPAVYRGARYVAVSEATRRELVALGVRGADISVVRNGCEPPRGAPHPSPTPRVLVLGRLVPHKRVEHVLAAARALREELPDLRVAVVGDGWWAEQLAVEARRLGVADLVELVGFADEPTKHAELASAWVLALPSLKEGWGLVVMEAAGYRVPTVAYASAGGVAESVRDGVTGVLAQDEAGFLAGLRLLLTDGPLRDRLGRAAAERAACFGWDVAAREFTEVLLAAAGHREAVGLQPDRVDPAHVHHGPGPGTTKAVTPRG